MSVQIPQEQSYAYAELLEILSFTHTSLVRKIPNKLISLFKDYALSTYEHHLNRDIPIDEQDISKQTAALLIMIHINYWCETEEEKNKIKAILAENEAEEENKLREQYNPNTIFNNSPVNTTPEKNETTNISYTETKISSGSSDVVSTNLPVDLSNLPWYKKIIISLKKIFSKNKK